MKRVYKIVPYGEGSYRVRYGPRWFCWKSAWEYDWGDRVTVFFKSLSEAQVWIDKDIVRASNQLTSKRLTAIHKASNPPQEYP